MRTVKLVVIGPSGVGKTSLRNQYISGRFTTGYRATIGADFITKTLPHHDRPDEKVTVQIWDTAGQERFSSLSSAFFRGADAVLLMFDVNEVKSLEALTKWWQEFKERAPVLDEDAHKFCCVFVGNKTDKGSPSSSRHAPSASHSSTSSTSLPSTHGVKPHLAHIDTSPTRVTESQAQAFIDQLIPPVPTPSPPTPIIAPSTDNLNRSSTSNHYSHSSHHDLSLPITTSPTSATTPHVTIPPPRESIDIEIYARRYENGRVARKTSFSRSRSRSAHFGRNGGGGGGGGAGTIGTMTTTHSIYHTPSSSFFEDQPVVHERERETVPKPPSASNSAAPTSTTSSFFSFYTSIGAFTTASRNSIQSQKHPSSSVSLSPRSPSHSPVRGPTPSSQHRQQQQQQSRRRVPSLLSTSSAPTITPSLYVQSQSQTDSQPPTTTPPTPSSLSSSSPTTPTTPTGSLPLSPRLGHHHHHHHHHHRHHHQEPIEPPETLNPKLFFTSAKTGEGVAEVFEYIARRVVLRWEYEEEVETRRMHVLEMSGGSGGGGGSVGRKRGSGNRNVWGWGRDSVERDRTVRLNDGKDGTWFGREGACCGS